MQMRRTISISLACFVTSACAIAETSAESTTQSIGVTPGDADMPAQSRSFPCGAEELRSAARVEQQRAHLADACDGVSDLCCGPVRVAEISQFGKASWYDHVGSQTASGEILDTVTATAAHRSLPLASYAKVTNLDNSRSVIVKINDRGPYIHGRIIDLSPRAADTLAMKRAGIVAVVVEPLVY